MPAWTPSPEWKGQDAVIIGGGSSLQGFDFTQLKDQNVIGCNSAFKLGAELIDICLFGDTSWWELNKWDLEKFSGRVVTCNPALYTARLSWLLQLRRVRDGLHSGDTLGWNFSTGAAAINLAVSLGAERIYLLGFDMGLNSGGKSHWHSYYQKKINVEAFHRHLRGFSTLANSLRNRPEVSVFNVTDGSSKLTVFPCIPLSELLHRFQYTQETATV